VRIVSLLPSTTEILFAIGAGDQVVGVTFECDFPPEAQTRDIVSTTSLPEGLSPAEIDAEVKARLAAGEDIYRLDANALRHLDPDVVVTQDLCAVCAVAVSSVDQALDHLGCRAEVVTIDPMTLEQVLQSIVVLGKVTGHDTQADALVNDLQKRLATVNVAVAGRPRPRVAVLEWTNPLFSAGHWVPDLVAAAGAANTLGKAGARSRQIDTSALQAANPDIVVVAPCGYRLAGATALAADLVDSGAVPPAAQVWAVDADAMFVRPGPRLVDGVETLAGICHPESVAGRPDACDFVAGPRT
jgi:iron complex transport system substrate-binding protein